MRGQKLTRLETHNLEVQGRTQTRTHTLRTLAATQEIAEHTYYTPDT